MLFFILFLILQKSGYAAYKTRNDSLTGICMSHTTANKVSILNFKNPNSAVLTVCTTLQKTKM